MVRTLWHGMLSCWSQPSEDGYIVVIKGWTQSATMLNIWYKAECLACLQNLDSTIYNSQQKLRLIWPGNSLQSFVTEFWWVLAHMSYTCGLLLLYSTCFKDNCAFRHAFLYTLVVTSSYWSCCFLPLIFRQSGHSPLTFGTRHFYLEWLIYRPFSVNRRDVCVGKSQLPSRFCRRQTRSTTTNNKLQSPFFPILMDSLIFRMHLHA